MDGEGIMKRPKYANLGELTEDKRIELIGHRVVDHHEQVAFIVEDDAKADRYVAKLLEQFLGLIVKHRGPGPKGTIAVVLIPAERVN